MTLNTRTGTAAPASYNDWKASIRSVVEQTLQTQFDVYPDTPVRAACMYVALSGGHRWRPLVSLASGQIFHENPSALVMPAACGIELAHAASLILDDLPSMDDAELRRGKACVHRVFPAWATDMAPVFLVNMSYDLSLSNTHVAENARIKTALIAAQTGLRMITGQVEDVEQNRNADPEKRLLELYENKSGFLYAAAGSVGALSAGASEEDSQIISEACLSLGLAYQYMDDIADVTADQDAVGKTTGKDIDKITTVDLFGIEGTRARSLSFQEDALEKLSPFGPRADNLRALVSEASWKAF